MSRSPIRGDCRCSAWTTGPNGWLPSLYQGTVVRSKEPRILNLDAPMSLKGEAQDRYLNFLGKLNREHLAQRTRRIRSRGAHPELRTRRADADRRQGGARHQRRERVHEEALRHRRSRDPGFRKPLPHRATSRGARRALCQPLHRATRPGTTTRNIVKSLPDACKYVDKPAAALVIDLKQRGLLDSTVVHWGGEMGRLPCHPEPLRHQEPRERRPRSQHLRLQHVGRRRWIQEWLRPRRDRRVRAPSSRECGEPLRLPRHAAAALRTRPEKLTYKRNGVAQTLVENEQARVVSGTPCLSGLRAALRQFEEERSQHDINWIFVCNLDPAGDFIWRFVSGIQCGEILDPRVGDNRCCRFTVT